MYVQLPVSLDDRFGTAMDVPTMLGLIDRMLAESRSDPCLAPFADALENARNALADLRRAALEAMMEVDAESSGRSACGNGRSIGNC